MRKSACLLVLLIPFVGSCVSSVDASISFNIAGVYEMIWYSNATVSDDNPGGTLQAVEVDNDHINLLVKGQSGKIKVNYTYNNVLVINTSTGNADQITYNLSYKNRIIGSARVDGVSRYIILNPSSALRIEGLDL